MTSEAPESSSPAYQIAYAGQEDAAQVGTFVAVWGQIDFFLGLLGAPKGLEFRQAGQSG